MPLIFASCGPKSASNGSSDDDFALGADISWYTEYESRGHKFYNLEGKEGDCNQVMKDCGLNAVRLRVWVDPAGRPRPKWADEFKEYKADSWCDKNDLLVKCKRAKESIIVTGGQIPDISLFLMLGLIMVWSSCARMWPTTPLKSLPCSRITASSPNGCRLAMKQATE